MEEERLSGGRLVEALDASDKDGVVAAGMAGFVGHLEGRTAIGEQRRPAEAGAPPQTGEAIDRPGREAVG